MSTYAASNRIRLGILVALAIPQLLIGLWAVVAPRNWFDNFPAINPRLVAAHPPFNEHLAADAGAGFLATGLALAAAALWGHRAAIQIGLLGYVTFGAPHLLYHVANPAAALSGGEDLLNLALLATGPTVAGLFAWRIRTRTPQPPTTQRQAEVLNDEAQVVDWAHSDR